MFARMLRRNVVVWSCVVALVLSTHAWSPAAGQEAAADLPVKRVVIFSSGVSFFEHGGQIEGNAKVDLKFNVEDINDLLKSMVLQDLGGGRISSVAYESRDPVTRTLRTFAIDLTRNPTLADLLAQIRGEQIEVDVPNRVVGTIVGVEKRRERVNADQTVEIDYLTLLTDEGLRSVGLDKVGRIKLSNAKLDAELRQALTVLAMSHSTDKKTVSLNFLGQGQRQVRVGYIQESPVWKTSYRLVLSDDAPPLLQGWAIVENTTEADWNNVSLTLVSGRPISFIMDLYQPLYVNRPVVQPELYASLRPRTYDQDLAAADMEFRKAGEKRDEALAAAAPEAAKNRALYRAPGAPPADGAFGYLAQGSGQAGDAKWNMQQGVRSVAQAGDVGEMFRYQIATPVTLERSRSAMLPIVNESVEGTKVSIYNESTHGKHPLNGLKLKNTTDLHLMQGPITVFDDSAYAGDAQIQDLPPATERLISYAMDLDTEVAPASKGQPTQLVSCRLVKGVLYTSNKHGRTKSYVVKNSGKKPKTVLIEHPVEPSWTLIEPKEPAEKTRDLYRFSVTAEPGKPLTLDVKEEQVSNESIAVTNLQESAIRIYLSAQIVGEKVKEALRDVIQRKAEIEAVTRQRQEFERQIIVIEQEQKRIRDNMAQLPKESDLFRRYVTKFTEQEDSIEDLRTKVTAAVADEAKLRKSLDDYLIGLDLS